MRDGLRKFQYKDVEFSKINYKSRLPGVEIKSGRKRPNYSHKFKKLGHWLHSDPHLVLVHYLGDETIYKPMAHGNSKIETEFKRTMLSVIDKMKFEEGGAKKVYRKIVCTDQVDGNMQGIANPRNTKQVKNVQQIKKNVAC